MEKPSPERSIRRYMSVSNFLMLLDGAAFFPSIKKLREVDPLESSLSDALSAMLWDMVVESGERELVMNLVLNEKSAKDKRRCAPEVDDDFLSDAAREVLGKLLACKIAERRAAWCWFESDIESASMWHIYGNRGIAVTSTIGDLIAALPDSLDHTIGSITYVDRKSGSERSIEKLCSCSKELLRKPYFLKASEFASESEVRVVIRCADLHGRGTIVDGIDTKRLIREVVISPLLSTGESEAITNLVVKKLDDPSLCIRQSDLRGDPMVRSIQEWGFYTQRSDDEMDLPSLMRSI